MKTAKEELNNFVKLKTEALASFVCHKHVVAVLRMCDVLRYRMCIGVQRDRLEFELQSAKAELAVAHEQFETERAEVARLTEAAESSRKELLALKSGAVKQASETLETRGE